MEMKRFLYILILLFIFSLTGCLLFFRPLDYPVDQVFKYEPKKAGAEIAAKVSLPEEIEYINYQNNQYFYIVYDNTTDVIKFFDIANDEIIIKKEIQIPKKEFEYNGVYNYTYCMNMINDKMVLLANFWDNSTDFSFSSMLVLDESSDSLTFYDNSSDFDNITLTTQFYYDNNHFGYSASSSFECPYYRRVFSNKDVLKCYDYNNESNHFEIIKDINIDNCGYIYLTNGYMFLNDYMVSPNAAVTNMLYIYNINTDCSVSMMKKLNLTFLNLSDEISGAFSDNEGNIWLSVTEYDRNTRTHSFSLIKLKLLDSKAADNEYITQCW